jgi:hypothetical protein
MLFSLDVAAVLLCTLYVVTISHCALRSLSFSRTKSKLPAQHSHVETSYSIVGAVLASTQARCLLAGTARQQQLRQSATCTRAMKAGGEVERGYVIVVARAEGRL